MERRNVGEQVADRERLDRDGYRRLRDAASTERQEIVVRLAGEVGLRPAEIADLSLRDVESRDHDGTSHFFLRVGSDDAGEDQRVAYLPADLESALRAYGSAADRAPADPLFSVSARRIQMIVREATEGAASGPDAPAVGAVSTRELRRFHARELLDHGVNPRVVSEITAWSRLETLAESYGPATPEAIMDALSGVDLGGEADPLDATGGDVGRPPASGGAGRRLVELVDHVVELGVALSGASTREAIEREACGTLASFYEYAWIASEVDAGGFQFRARSIGADAGELEQVDAPPGNTCREVYDTGEATIATGERLPRDGTDEPTVRAIVPIRHADTTYGVLEVGIRAEPGGITDREERLLCDLGRRLGQGIAAVERRRLLLADTVLRLSFTCTDTGAVFVRLSAAFECTFALTGLVPGEDGSLLAFVWLEGASPDDVFQRATEDAAVDSARLIRSADDGSLLEFVLTADSPALTLVECGGSLTELSASEGRATMTAEFVPDVDVREVVESVEADFPDSEMTSKREVERSVQTDTEFEQALTDTLTNKQRSALRAAYLSGYFDWPRGSTAEELADSLGVSSPTFHSHLRRAQRKILATFLEDP